MHEMRCSHRQAAVVCSAGKQSARAARSISRSLTCIAFYAFSLARSPPTCQTSGLPTLSLTDSPCIAQLVRKPECAPLSALMARVCSDRAYASLHALSAYMNSMSSVSRAVS